MQRRFKETDSSWVREEMERFQDTSPCEVCKGYRLKPEALAVKIGALHIGEVCAKSIRVVDTWFRDIDKKLNKQQNEIAARILKEIRARLKFLNNVGLDYLTLSRNSGTAVGRREPAHPPGLADRLGPDRRALRPRRALHRPAPARQREAAGIA